MGYSLSSPIANLVMEYVEENILATIPFHIPIYKRYVDDVLMSVPCDQLDYILQIFNGYHNTIRFTMEVDKEKSLNFLDLTLSYKNNDNKIKTSWFTKKVNSGRYLNYNSCIPISFKKSVINGLVDRAIKLTNSNNRKFQLNKVKNMLINNNYPVNFINNVIKNRVHKLYNSNNLQKVESTYVCIPYTPILSEKIKGILGQYNIRIANRPFNTLDSLYSQLKDKIESTKESNVVYKISCLDCPGQYVGQTKQYLNKRVYSHKYSIQCNDESTALSRHSKELNHHFDFNNVSILDRESNYKKRLIKEMINIKKEKNSINFRTDIQNLSILYNGIL